MLYSAIAVARHIITYCSKKNKPISNLKLQKLLYYAWIGYFKRTSEPLFIDDICAWQLGPVVPEVYYEFCPYAGTPIFREYDEQCSNEDIEIIDAVIDRLIDYSASELVSMTHQEGKPWDVVYMNGQGLREVIPFPLIVDLECRQ